jgi:2-methylisocitrate lyase-like PEP mutase family enzyme
MAASSTVTNGSNGHKRAGKPAAAARLRELLSNPSKMLVAPGVYDGLTARIALREGFDCE